MYHINANTIAGQNLSRLRDDARISQSALADRINASCDLHFTSAMVGRFERGERGLELDDLVAMAIGLDCSMQAALDMVDPRLSNLPATYNAIARLTTEEHAVFRKMATDWRGDRKAYIIATALYMALPEKYALAVIMGMVEQMSLALAAGDLSPADLPQNLPYLENSIGALSEKLRK